MQPSRNMHLFSYIHASIVDHACADISGCNILFDAPHDKKKSRERRSHHEDPIKIEVDGIVKRDRSRGSKLTIHFMTSRQQNHSATSSECTCVSFYPYRSTNTLNERFICFLELNCKKQISCRSMWIWRSTL